MAPLLSPCSHAGPSTCSKAASASALASCRHHSLTRLSSSRHTRIPSASCRAERFGLRTTAILSVEKALHLDIIGGAEKEWTVPLFGGFLRHVSSLLRPEQDDAEDSEPECPRQAEEGEESAHTNRPEDWRRGTSRPRELPRSEWAYRREITMYGLGVLLSVQALLPFCGVPHAMAQSLESLLQQPGTAEAQQVAPLSRGAKADTTVTHKVYMDFALCPTAVRLERTLGDRSLICRDGEPMGRVVLGLYGNQVPVTVQQFVDMVTGKSGSSYKGTIIQKSLPGQYIMAGRQGAQLKGEVPPPSALDPNSDTVKSSSFLLDHLRPGTLSLALSENDDEAALKERAAYRNVEFLITTGPGPASQLDSRNIVFGTVLEGMDVVRSITEVPTYQPNERIRQFNDFAAMIGDDRAAKGRATWGKPLKAIVINECGLVEPVTPQLLPPSQP